jgi:Na+/H+ antiporter NhaD/arsenite permease-like protein
MKVDGDSADNPLSGAELATRFGILAVASTIVGSLAHYTWGLTNAQTISVTVFLVIILATLFFWSFRLAIAFIGLPVLILTQTLELECFRQHCSLEVILFLIGMMVVVGGLRDLGFFTWIIQAILKMKGMSGARFVLVSAGASALTASMVDEVTSILFMAALIFQVCDVLKVRPTPFLIISVMATNVGSAGTMLGNPVGILIGSRAGLTFEDFMLWAFPVMLLSLAATILLLMVWYRHEIRELDTRLKQRREHSLPLGPTVAVPIRAGLLLIGGTIGLVALHHRIELLLELETNTVLYMAPLIAAGIVMIWRRGRARYYIEHDVEWWTLLFFLMLFGVAGTLQYTEVTGEIASSMKNLVGADTNTMIPVVMLMSALGSAFIDNVIFVAAFIPVLQELLGDAPAVHPAWWALLFGACFGGNITMIGSTANIVALGMMEKRYRTRINFLEWFRVGLAAGITACLVAWLALLVTGPLMPGAQT